MRPCWQTKFQPGCDVESLGVDYIFDVMNVKLVYYQLALFYYLKEKYAYSLFHNWLPLPFRMALEEDSSISHIFSILDAVALLERLDCLGIRTRNKLQCSVYLPRVPKHKGKTFTLKLSVNNLHDY